MTSLRGCPSLFVRAAYPPTPKGSQACEIPGGGVPERREALMVENLPTRQLVGKISTVGLTVENSPTSRRRGKETVSCVCSQDICCVCRQNICCVSRQDICCVSRQDICGLPRHPRFIAHTGAAAKRPPLCCQCLGDAPGDHRCLVCLRNKCLVH